MHPDFPVEAIRGAIGGGQPKLLLKRSENGYVTPKRPREDVMHRFQVANEIANQLVSYFKRKKMENPEWTDEKNYERIRLALIQKGVEGKWPFTKDEQLWIMDRLRERSAEIK